MNYVYTTITILGRIFKKLEAFHNGKKYLIAEDLPQVGWYLYLFDKNGNNTHDYLQDTEQIAKEQAYEDFGVPIEN